LTNKNLRPKERRFLIEALYLAKDTFLGKRNNFALQDGQWHHKQCVVLKPNVYFPNKFLHSFTTVKRFSAGVQFGVQGENRTAAYFKVREERIAAVRPKCATHKARPPEQESSLRLLS
jgi:hypothetical protein